MLDGAAADEPRPERAAARQVPGEPAMFDARGLQVVQHEATGTPCIDELGRPAFVIRVPLTRRAARVSRGGLSVLGR